MKQELRRKGVHMLLALLFAAIASSVHSQVLIWAGLALFVAFALGRVLRLCAHVGGVPRVTFGELFFALGIIATAVISNGRVELFQMGMLILALADPLAAVIGIGFGRHEYQVLGEVRTYEGSLACFVTVALVLAAFGVSVPIAIPLALVLTAVEAVSPRGSDNLFLPSLTVLAISLLT